MKYLSIIYYDTFARFFAAIEDAVKLTDPSAQFLHLAIFPSGWLYMKGLGREVRLLPWEITRPYSSVSADDATLDKIAYYHSVTCRHNQTSSTAELRLRAQAYVGTMARVVESFQPDAILFSGDTRFACESMRYYLEKSNNKAKKFFFEQGPNGTTIFDTNGVNANCSFRSPVASLTGEGFSPQCKVKIQKFKRNPLFRGCDYALIAVLRLLRRLPPEWDSMALKKLPESEYARCIRRGHDVRKLNTSEILVALQVPDDANNIHHNPLGLADVELVRWALDAARVIGLSVRVREHPLYRRRYTPSLYKLLFETDRASLSDADLDDDLKNAKVVVTVNSMTGLDAYLRKIPVVTLGDSFYDHLPGIDRVRSEAELTTSLREIFEGGFEKRLGGADPANVFSEMSHKFLLRGHYLEGELESPKRIAEILARELNI